jgi:hypothetical protein
MVQVAVLYDEDLIPSRALACLQAFADPPLKAQGKAHHIYFSLRSPAS